jgi:hypothetical protein
MRSSDDVNARRVPGRGISLDNTQMDSLESGRKARVSKEKTGSQIPKRGPSFIMDEKAKDTRAQDKLRKDLGKDADGINAGILDYVDTDAGLDKSMVEGLIEKMQKDESLSPDMVLRLTRAIRGMDKDGDGNIGADEIIYFVMKEVAEAQKVQGMRRIIFGMAAFIFLMLIGNFALSFVVVGLTKQTEMAGSTMTALDGSVVQTGSSDYKIGPDGSMQLQLGLEGVDESLVAAPLRTAPSVTEKPLTSRVPDKYIRQLKSFFYTDPNSGDVQYTNVHSFHRKPTIGALCGSVLVLHTSNGNFTLDDEHLYLGGVEVDVTGNFDLARHRKLSTGQLSGFFDYIEDSDFECVREWDGVEETITPTPPVYPMSYTMMQDHNCGEENENCLSFIGANSGMSLPGLLDAPGGGKKIRVFTQVLMTNEMTVQVKSFPNHPLQKLVTITLNETLPGARKNSNIQFQLFADSQTMLRCFKGNQTLEGDDPYAPDSMLISFLGMDTETDSRRFRLTPKIPKVLPKNGDPVDDSPDELDPSAMSLELWESLESGKTVRMFSPGNEWRTPITHLSDHRMAMTSSQIKEWLEKHLNGMYDQLEKPFDDIQCHNIMGIIYNNMRIPEVPKMSRSTSEKQENVKIYSALIENFPLEAEKHNNEYIEAEAMEAADSIKTYWGRFKNVVPQFEGYFEYDGLQSISFGDNTTDSSGRRLLAGPSINSDDAELDYMSMANDDRRLLLVDGEEYDETLHTKDVYGRPRRLNVESMDTTECNAMEYLSDFKFIGLPPEPHPLTKERSPYKRCRQNCNSGTYRYWYDDRFPDDWDGCSCTDKSNIWGGGTLTFGTKFPTPKKLAEKLGVGIASQVTRETWIDDADDYSDIYIPLPPNLVASYTYTGGTKSWSSATDDQKRDMMMHYLVNFPWSDVPKIVQLVKLIASSDKWETRFDACFAKITSVDNPSNADQTICGDHDCSEGETAPAPSPPPPPPPPTYQMRMYDSWGDGWNGAKFTWTDANGAQTKSSHWYGSYKMYTIGPTSGCNTVCVDSGGWPSEISWKVYDDKGSRVAYNFANKCSTFCAPGSRRRLDAPDPDTEEITDEFPFPVKHERRLGTSSGGTSQLERSTGMTTDYWGSMALVATKNPREQSGRTQLKATGSLFYEIHMHKSGTVYYKQHSRWWGVCGFYEADLDIIANTPSQALTMEVRNNGEGAWIRGAPTFYPVVKLTEGDHYDTTDSDDYWSSDGFSGGCKAESNPSVATMSGSATLDVKIHNIQEHKEVGAPGATQKGVMADATFEMEASFSVMGISFSVSLPKTTLLSNEELFRIVIPSE